MFSVSVKVISLMRIKTEGAKGIKKKNTEGNKEKKKRKQSDVASASLWQ